MKKKSSSPAAVTTVTTTVDDGDITALIHEHANYFDKLVEAIPARFYVPPKEKPYIQGLSKSGKAAYKRQTKQNLRNARLNRFDPEKSSKTTLDALNESIEFEKLENKLSFEDASDRDSDDDDEEEEEDGEDEDEERKVTYEELRRKMQRKLEALKAGRERGEGFERRLEKREEWKRKRNRADFQGDKKVKGKGKEKEKEKEKESERVIVEKEVEEASKEIEFGKVKLVASIDDVLSHKKNKKRKLSKEEELKRALELEEAKKDPDKGNTVKTKHAWKAATDRAMGLKVHDNPNRLKKSLENDKRKQEKSKETWKKRLETTANHKKAKQEKRKANINAKLNSKKQAKIAKREKKFMRPGFEGRKEGFITGE